MHLTAFKRPALVVKYDTYVFLILAPVSYAVNRNASGRIIDYLGIFLVLGLPIPPLSVINILNRTVKTETTFITCKNTAFCYFKSVAFLVLVYGFGS